jgi:hypothetical protein
LLDARPFQTLRRAGAGGDRDHHLAALFAPAGKREALFALYAFSAEISRVRDLAREPMPAKFVCNGGAKLLESGPVRPGQLPQRRSGNGDAVPVGERGFGGSD